MITSIMSYVHVNTVSVHFTCRFPNSSVKFLYLCLNLLVTYLDHSHNSNSLILDKRSTL